MKASEMTNDELADYIVNVIGGGIFKEYYAEAAARLRKFDITLIAQQAKSAAEGYAHGREEVANLRRRLKVAEEICEHEIASRQKTPARCEMCLEDSSAGEDCPYHCKSCGCNSPTYGEFPSEKECEPFVEILAAIREEGDVK